MIRTRANILAAALAGAILGLLPAGASAQQQVDMGGGRALDANARVGSGGVNRAENQIDYRLRNDVVTGNVGLGRAFRGDIDYNAPGEFQGQLGSDDLFRFRAESLGGSPRGPLSAPELYRGYALGGGTSVYRSYTSLPATRPIHSPFATRTNINVGGYGDYGTAYDPGRLTQQGLLGSQLLGGVGDRLTTQDTFGVVTGPEGRLLEVTASPLLGLRTYARPGQQAIEAELFQPSLVPGQDELERFERPERNLQEGELGEEAGVSLRQDYRLDQEARLPMMGPERDLPLEPTRIAPSLLIGRGLQTSRADLEPVQERYRRIEQRLLAPLETAEGEQTGDVYLDILQAVRDREVPEDRLAAAPEDELEPRRGEQPREPWQVQRPGVQPRELPGQQPAEPEQPAAEAEPREDAEEGEAPGVLDRLVGRLDYNLPPLESLVSERETRVAQRMREAEQALAEGEYLRAESLYRRTLVDQPDQAMARVGMVHAQHGAGMIRSAALQLRQLFEEHPELIAAKYSDRLLPDTERIEWLENELQQMIGRDGVVLQPGLVLAYLGYQTQQPELIEAGLAAAEANQPRDPLLPLLRRIWLESPQDSPSEPPAGRQSQEP